MTVFVRISHGIQFLCTRSPRVEPHGDAAIFARQQRDPEYVVVRELPVGKRGDAVA
ncbi:hypothetical protein M3I56_17560 [Paraburkholderia sp. CNPSo 3281]|nr:hypothetical protein [Paraburkholderia sp. CNPSo 3281]